MTDAVRDYKTRFDVAQTTLEEASRSTTKASLFDDSNRYDDAIDAVDETIEVLEAIKDDLREECDHE